MVNITKWSGIAATLSSLAVIALPAFFSVSHQQALLSLLLGEIAAIALAHSAYRASSGKQAAPLGIATAIVCGVVLMVSPIIFYPVDPYLTVMLGISAIIVAGGVAAGADRLRGGAEGRQSGAQRLAGGQ
jgi:hypothetical protein